MNQASAQAALKQYRQIGVHGGIEDASPHRLIQMLMTAALERMHTARGLVERLNGGVSDVGATAEKGSHIGSAISIVDGLRTSLDMQRGGEIAANLDNLYDYMGRRLLEANLSNRVDILDEVIGLLAQIKDAWDTIAPAASAEQPEA
jgi:flagellar protein FliS